MKISNLIHHNKIKSNLTLFVLILIYFPTFWYLWIISKIYFGIGLTI